MLLRPLRPEQAATVRGVECEAHGDPQENQSQVGGHVVVRDEGDRVKGRGEAEQRVGGIEVVRVTCVHALLCVVVEDRSDTLLSFATPARARVCVCVCVCARARACCVCVCV